MLFLFTIFCFIWIAVGAFGRVSISIHSSKFSICDIDFVAFIAGDFCNIHAFRATFLLDLKDFHLNHLIQIIVIAQKKVFLTINPVEKD